MRLTVARGCATPWYRDYRFAAIPTGDRSPQSVRFYLDVLPPLVVVIIMRRYVGYGSGPAPKHRTLLK